MSWDCSSSAHLSYDDEDEEEEERQEDMMRLLKGGKLNFCIPSDSRYSL